MLRKLIGALAVGGLLVTFMPQPASAAPTITVVFTAGATLNNELYWPAAAHPDCLADGDVDCPAPAGTTYSFSTEPPGVGIGGQRFCAAVVDDGANTHTSIEGTLPGVTPDPPCKLSSTGAVNAGLLIGPHCGWSSGGGPIGGDGGPAADVPTVDLDAAGIRVSWPQSAGTILPLVYQDSGADGIPGNADDNIIGAGAVQSTGANNSVCGANPTNPDGTTAFAVTGFTTTSQ